MKNKIKTLQEITAIAEKLRREGKIIVMTNGCFDILHSAHINFFSKIKQEGDILIVFLNSDISIKKNKGEKRPIIPEEERANILSAIGSIDYIVLFDEDTPLKCFEQVKGQICAKGGKYILSRLREEQKLLDKWGGKHKIFKLEKGISSTNIIDRILERYSER